ncbi:MAG: hypothetical protein ABGX12_06585 [Desulfurobacteriaceae bacterium]
MSEKEKTTQQDKGKKPKTMKVLIKEETTLIINGVKETFKKGVHTLPVGKAQILLESGYAEEV